MAELLKKGETIQSSITLVNAPKTIMHFSKKFVEQMQKDNVDSAIKLITNNTQNGMLPLAENTLKLLTQKDSKSAPSTEEVLLPNQPESTHQIQYENINADAVCKAVLKTKGSSGPSDGYRWLEKDSYIQTIC